MQSLHALFCIYLYVTTTAPACLPRGHPVPPSSDPGAEAAVVLGPPQVVDKLHHLLFGLLQPGHVAEPHPAALAGQRVDHRELGPRQRALGAGNGKRISPRRPEHPFCYYTRWGSSGHEWSGLDRPAMPDITRRSPGHLTSVYRFTQLPTKQKLMV